MYKDYSFIFALIYNFKIAPLINVYFKPCSVYVPPCSSFKKSKEHD